MIYYLMHLSNSTSLAVPIPTYSNITTKPWFFFWSTYHISTYLFRNKTKDLKYNITVHEKEECFKSILCNDKDQNCNERFSDCIQKDSCLLSSMEDLRASPEEFGVSGVIEYVYSQNLC